ncbi:tyrosine-type recombinase/integrase [Noviherbaspirillum pedocola]|uniref:Site-specific integrase n=1 Tax=Noviherbaspirillum pedocola TaxID=2801341 RepID=A0A934T0L5_9BURK|nr:tyrosine-type recombinase/integrase [Noviherbaspirillum pedocola]MBK4736319.1 site-specific integrase [Noviherbaspirillum pedocola]
MLNLPIYLRGSSYYLHTRVAGKQLKRSLQTKDKKTAIIRAVRMMEFILSKIVNPDSFDLSNVRKYEIDISKGIYRADGPEDHQMMMEALKSIKGIGISQVEPETSTEKPQQKKKTGLTMPEVLEKLFLVKPHLSQATILSYRKAVTEFSQFLKNPMISNIGKIDVTKYQEYLANKGNTSRTIDNKISVLGSIFNFAVTQGYMFSDNPAKERKLLSNKEKKRTGYAIFQRSEITEIFDSAFLKTAKQDDPDYYWTLVLGLITGCRISEITSLTKQQFKVTESGIRYIKINDSKTQAGVRSIPISDRLFINGLEDFIADKEEQIFKYKLRLGKGSGNAVGKKFKRHLEELGIDRPKLVFHSLRKFCNDFLKNTGIPYEARCQYIGHEIDDINNTFYSNEFTVEMLAEILKKSLFQLEMMAGLIRTKF